MMLATHASPSPPTARPCLLPSSRSALADSTNANTHADGYGPSPKSLVYPTSSTRTRCGWSDIEPSTESILTPSYARYHHLSCSSSPFSVIYKAPPTVSVSLSAACSQNIPAKQLGSSGVQGSELDLPDVRSVVPFPSTPSDGDMDVEMLDGTCAPYPDGHLPRTAQAPRKRRSAHSSISSSQGSLGKDAKQKRPRKCKRQVAELWWLGVIHRSILCIIEARQSSGELDAMDRVLVERIQKRLAENGCGEGRLPSLSPRSPSLGILAPSLNLLTSNRKTQPLDSPQPAPPPEFNPKENSALDRTASKAPPCASLSIISYSPISSSTSTSPRRHVRFEIPQRPRPLQSHPSIPRRSPSPPARTGSVPPNAQTLTLTMPQLVASLTLAYHERGGSRLRGRTGKPMEYGKNAGRSPSSVERCDDGKDGLYQPFTLRARLLCAPERKSPLSHVAYVDD